METKPSYQEGERVNKANEPDEIVLRAAKHVELACQNAILALPFPDSSLYAALDIPTYKIQMAVDLLGQITSAAARAYTCEWMKGKE